MKIKEDIADLPIAKKFNFDHLNIIRSFDLHVVDALVYKLFSNKNYRQV